MLAVENEPPGIDDADNDPDRGGEPWVTIRTYWSSPEAHIARLKLEAEDVECMLIDENFIATDWGIASAAGGIKLKVCLPDAEAAAALLADLPAPQDFVEAPQSCEDQSSNCRCPRCGSSDVYREGAWRRPALTLLAITFSMGIVVLFALPWILGYKRPWHCYDCGNEWAAHGGTGARGFPVRPTV